MPEPILRVVAVLAMLLAFASLVHALGYLEVVSLVAEPDPAFAGGTVTFTVTLMNWGPDARPEVSVFAWFGSEVVYTPVEPCQGEWPHDACEPAEVVCSNWSCAVSQGECVFTAFSNCASIAWTTRFGVAAELGNLGPGQSATLQFILPLELLPVGEPLLWVESPPSIAGEHEHQPGMFGPPWDGEWEITAELVMVEPHDACDPLENPADLVGKIALIDRGGEPERCQFGDKCLKAQQAGAVGCIIADDLELDIFGFRMGAGTFGAEVEIPATMVSTATGNILKAELAGRVIVTLGTKLPVTDQWTLYTATYRFPWQGDYDKWDPNPELIEHTLLILGVGAPVVAFTFEPASPRVGEEVQFHDQSTGDPSGWEWDFGDGVASSEQHPIHVFSAEGVYTVTLTVTDDVGWDQATADIVVLPGPLPNVVYIPVAANTAGVGGTDWSSDVEVSNRGQGYVRYDVNLLASGRDNSDPQVAGTFTLAPGLAVRYVDAVEELFDFEGTGALRFVLAEYGKSGPTTLITSRTYTTSSSGTFGQFIPGVSESALVPAGQSVRLQQLSENQAFRTNVGLLNGSDQVLVVHLRYVLADGTMLGEESIGLEPYEHRQLNRAFTRVTADTVDDAHVDAWTDTEGGVFYCYASVVDNLSGDPTFISPM
jgi:PKD repeat protein